MLDFLILGIMIVFLDLITERRDHFPFDLYIIYQGKSIDIYPKTRIIIVK